MRQRWSGLPHRLLAFVDLETGGLAPDAEILQVACIITDPSGRHVLWRGVDTVTPEHPELLEPSAIAINGYTAEAWSTSVPLKQALQRITDQMGSLMAEGDSIMFVAHNSPFDVPRLTAAIEAAGLSLPPGGHHSIDTATLAWPLVKSGVLPGQSLAALCDHFGLARDHPHDALSDTDDCRQVYVRLMRLYLPLRLRLARLAHVLPDAIAQHHQKRTAPPPALDL